MIKTRLDLLLVERGALPSREQAQRVIRAGRVFVDGQRADKPGRRFPADAAIRVESPPRYVGRGGDKLKGALDAFDLKVADRVVLDVGSSTGGFADCLLQEGARRVYCLDVGKGQLAWKLRQDPRVVVREGCNARYLTGNDLPETPDIITVDVSFISLQKVLPALANLLAGDGLILALIKPQFEAGRAEIKRGGVVRDSAAHQRVIEEIRHFSLSRGLLVEGVSESVLTGPAGNKEFFILLRAGAK
ncbi:MAG: TlyA family RNA methyltransferase [PVC group bacterium]